MTNTLSSRIAIYEELALKSPAELGQVLVQETSRRGACDMVKVRACIAMEADLEQRDGLRGLTSLQWAIRFGHNEAGRALIDANADLGVRDLYKRTLPMLAAVYKKHELLQAVIDKAQQKDAEDKAALAVTQDRPARARLRRNIASRSLNNLDQDGYTAMGHSMLGPFFNYEAAVSLARAGADPLVTHRTRLQRPRFGA